MKLRIHKGAADDLAEAARWYNDQRDQLGVEFALAFYDSVDTILEASRRWPEIFPGIRQFRFGHFQYKVVHAVEQDDVVFVLAVSHLSRDGDYWRDRLLREP